MLTIKLILVRGFLLFYDCCKNAVFPVIPAHKMQLGLTLSAIHKLLFRSTEAKKKIRWFWIRTKKGEKDDKSSWRFLKKKWLS